MLMDRWLDNGPAQLGQTTLSDRPVRSLVKALSWRATGSLDTMFLSWLFTQDVSIAVAIGMTEVLTKMLLYYRHSACWISGA